MNELGWAKDLEGGEHLSEDAAKVGCRAVF